MQKGFSPLYILIGFLVIISAVGVAYYLGTTTTQNTPTPQKQENPTPTQEPEVTQTLSPSPTSKPTTNLKTHTDSNYKYTIQYPNNWTLKQDKDSEGDPQVVLTKNTASPAKFSTTRLLPQIYISVTSPYSTSGTVCSNQSCKEDGTLDIKIKGNTYPAAIIKGEVINNQNPQDLSFDFYGFVFELPNKKVTLSNYGNDPISLNVFSSYRTSEEGQEIANILSTLSY